MSKDDFIEAHMRLVEKYLDKHPCATWEEAYDKTADRAYDHMRDRLADMGDAAKQRMKDSGQWPPKVKT